MREPEIHSFITDGLPDDHPLAYKTIYCDGRCGEMLHAGNNECMNWWVESGSGNFCLKCFTRLETAKEPLCDLTAAQQATARNALSRFLDFDALSLEEAIHVVANELDVSGLLSQKFGDFEVTIKGRVNLRDLMRRAVEEYTKIKMNEIED